MGCDYLYMSWLQWQFSWSSNINGFIQDVSIFIANALEIPQSCTKLGYEWKITSYRKLVYTPSQWETTLQCNVVSHWLGAYTNWSLWVWLLIHAPISDDLVKEALARALSQYKDHLSRCDYFHYKDKTVMSLIFIIGISAAHQPLAMYLLNYKALHWPILVSARLDVFKFLLAQLPKWFTRQLHRNHLPDWQFYLPCDVRLWDILTMI